MRIAFFMLAVVLLASCRKEADSFAGKANISFVNMSPGVLNLNVTVDGARANSLPLSYLGSLVSPGKSYLEVDAGVREVRVFSGSTAFYASNLFLEKNRNYTMVFYDTLNNNKLNYVLLTDDISVTDTSYAKVRFIYTVPNATESRLYLYNLGTGVIDSISQLKYITENPPGSLFSTFFLIKGGKRDIELVETATNTLRFLRLNFDLQPGKAYTFFASGYFDNIAYPSRLTFVRHN